MPRSIAPETTVAVVLAAGLSTRFSGDKLLHPLRGKALAAHVADTLASTPFRARLAVCPEDDTAREDLFASRGFLVIGNPDPARGMSSSLSLGAQWAAALHAEALLVCLADMPNVTADHLLNIVAALDEGGIAATECAGVRSPPAAFAASQLSVLTSLSGDRGARELLQGAAVVTAPAELVADFDTPADFG